MWLPIWEKEEAVGRKRFKAKRRKVIDFSPEVGCCHTHVGLNIRSSIPPPGILIYHSDILGGKITFATLLLKGCRKLEGKAVNDL